MQSDTIFPPLSIGEIVVDRYQFDDLCSFDQTTVLLTNYRVLIRWTSRFCLCFRQSSHSAIALNSIFHVGETRLPLKLIFVLLWLLFIPFALSIFGFIIQSIPMGISFLVVTIVIGITLGFYMYYLRKLRFVNLQGTFGSVTIKLHKNTARRCEAVLSEAAYQLQTGRSGRSLAEMVKAVAPPPPTLMPYMNFEVQQQTPAPIQVYASEEY